jgi:hypothetical protein
MESALFDQLDATRRVRTLAAAPATPRRCKLILSRMPKLPCGYPLAGWFEYIEAPSESRDQRAAADAGGLDEARRKRAFWFNQPSGEQRPLSHTPAVSSQTSFGSKAG